MSADVKVSGQLKNATHIHYTTTKEGTTYSFYSSGRQVSIQLIRTNGRMEYRNVANLPATPSSQMRLDLGHISRHFAGIK